MSQYSLFVHHYRTVVMTIQSIVVTSNMADTESSMPKSESALQRNQPTTSCADYSSRGYDASKRFDNQLAIQPYSLQEGSTYNFTVRVEGLSRCPRFRWHEAGSRRMMRRHGPKIRFPDRIPASVSGRSELRTLPVRAALAGWVHLPRMRRDAVLAAEEPSLHL